MATVGAQPKQIQVNLTEKHNKCKHLIVLFRMAKKGYLVPSTSEHKLYKSILLGLMSSIGEQVAYIRAYQQQVQEKKVGELEDYSFIIPEIRNIAYHHLGDTESQRSNLSSYRGVHIDNTENIVTYITGEGYDALLKQAERFIPPVNPYMRTIRIPRFNNPIGPYERLTMAKGAADEVIEIINIQKLGSKISSAVSASSFSLIALDFHLARMCVAYEDYREELALLKKTHPANINNVEALSISPKLETVFLKIHWHKLALAHGEGSVENARGELLNHILECQAHFRGLATKIQPSISQGDLLLRLQSILTEMQTIRNDIKSIDLRLSIKYPPDNTPLSPKEEKEKFAWEVMKKRLAAQYSERQERFNTLSHSSSGASSVVPKAGVGSAAAGSAASAAAAGTREGVQAKSILPQLTNASNGSATASTATKEAPAVPPDSTDLRQGSPKRQRTK